MGVMVAVAVLGVWMMAVPVEGQFDCSSFVGDLDSWCYPNNEEQAETGVWSTILPLDPNTCVSDIPDDDTNNYADFFPATDSDDVVETVTTDEVLNMLTDFEVETDLIPDPDSDLVVDITARLQSIAQSRDGAKAVSQGLFKALVRETDRWLGVVARIHGADISQQDIYSRRELEELIAENDEYHKVFTKQSHKQMLNMLQKSRVAMGEQLSRMEHVSKVAARGHENSQEASPLQRNAKSHLNETLPQPGFECDRFWYDVYMTTYLVPSFYPSYADCFSPDTDSPNLCCANSINRIDSNVIATFHTAIYTVEFARLFAEILCDGLGGTVCLIEATMNVIISGLRSITSAADLHIGMDSGALIGTINEGLVEVHIALNCTHTDNVGLRNLACNGEDDNCDGQIDNCAEDLVAPQLIQPAADILRWHNDENEAVADLARHDVCRDDCNDVQISYGSIVEKCEESYVPTTCTDTCGQAVTEDVTVRYDPDPPAVTCCIPEDFQTLWETNNLEDVHFQYQVTDNCASDEWPKVNLTISMNDDRFFNYGKSRYPVDRYYKAVYDYNRDLRVSVRGEKNEGTVRTYYFVVSAVDAAGNYDECEASVTVGRPHVYKTETFDPDNEDDLYGEEREDYPPKRFSVLYHEQLQKLSNVDDCDCL